MKLTFVNVGYGEAVLAQYPDPVLEGKTRTLLVDGGSAVSYTHLDVYKRQAFRPWCTSISRASSWTG